jgi:hypothetical protein
LKRELAAKFGGSLGAKLAPAPAAVGAASAPVRPEDKLKKTLKGLFK